MFRLKVKISVVFFLCFVLLFLLARVAVLVMASNYFENLNSHDILFSFLHGTRFDLHVLGLLFCPLVALFMLPYRNKTIIKIFSTIFVFIFVAFAIFLTADVIFFSIFNNHIGVEIFTSFTHLGFFVQMAFQVYYYITIPLFILLGFGVYLICRYIRCYPTTMEEKRFITKSVIVLILLMPLTFLIVKGKLQFHGRNLSIMDAQVLGNAQSKDLILNGLYTTMNAVRKHQKRRLYFDNPTENLHIVTAQEKQSDPSFPFERQRLVFNKKNNNYNFVLFVLESFDPVLIDKYPEVIPFFMQLKKQGTYYKNFLSSGNRSLIGVTATLFSVPYVWGLPTMKNGLGEKEFSRLATYYRHKGYRTLNIITDQAASDNANLMAEYMGFEQFFAKPNIPLTHQYPMFHKGFDYEGLEFLLRQINAGEGKFFAYFYTSTLHTPYDILVSKEHQLYPMDTEEHQFLNRASYTDAALANFFEKARKETWFKDTIFLFLPDHRAPLANRKKGTNITQDKFQSFLLMYGAGIPNKVEDIFGTQEDVLPTLLDLLNSSENYASSGQSLLDPYRTQNKCIYEEHDNTVHVVGPKTQQVASEATAEDILTLPIPIQEAIRFNEAIYKSLSNNTWKKK